MFDGACSDQKIIHGEHYTLGRLLTSDQPCDFGCLFCDGMHGDMKLEFIDECPPTITNIRTFRPCNTMNELSNGYSGDGDFNLTEFFADSQKQGLNALLPSLSGNDNT